MEGNTGLVTYRYMKAAQVSKYNFLIQLELNHKICLFLPQ